MNFCNYSIESPKCQDWGNDWQIRAGLMPLGEEMVNFLPYFAPLVWIGKTAAKKQYLYINTKYRAYEKTAVLY